MIVQIERIDMQNFVVRCIYPPNPPFKAIEIKHSPGKAVATAMGMLCFPDKPPEAPRLKGAGE